MTIPLIFDRVCDTLEKEYNIIARDLPTFGKNTESLAILGKIIYVSMKILKGAHV